MEQLARNSNVARVFRILGNLEMGQGRFPDSETAQPISDLEIAQDIFEIAQGHFYD